MTTAYRISVFFVLFLFSCSWTWADDVCRQLTGTVVDVATRQPVAASSLFLITAKGRVAVGQSGATGAFTVPVSCEATALIVSKKGYKEQFLALTNPAPPSSEDVPTYVVTVPLVPDKRQASVRPMRTEELTQLAITTMTDKRQRTLFFLTDIYTNLPLQARTCFYYTKADWTNCLDPDVIGRFEMAYAEPDLLTVGIKSPGYYDYADSLVIYGDNRRSRQDYRLMRDLVIASVQIKGGTRGEVFRCELRPENGVGVLMSATNNGWTSTFEVMPQAYRLVVTDERRQIRHQGMVSLSNGLNILPVNLPAPNPSQPAPVAQVAIPNLEPTKYIPPIYFLQSSYQLIPESEAVLRQMAKYLIANPQYKLKAIGHTDNVGDEKKNLALSEYRGMVTINFLRQLGVPETRMSSSGKGSKEPLVPNDTEEHRIQNRRVGLVMEKQ
jgi:outer membrane protein OmpA-like peptidoglycan-associated protein